jgi:hypothetical protein
MTLQEMIQEVRLCVSPADARLTLPNSLICLH